VRANYSPNADITQPKVCVRQTSVKTQFCRDVAETFLLLEVAVVPRPTGSFDSTSEAREAVPTKGL
jgi:hypothetical protein